VLVLVLLWYGGCACACACAALMWRLLCNNCCSLDVFTDLSTCGA
jgi:hypothetical protein